MTLDASYLEYKYRRYGMDHDFYEWSMLTQRPQITWPDNARVALWVNVGLQFFPLNQSGKPFAPPGGMSTAYPDLRHYTLRDYGNRVGIFRFFKAFDRFKIKPTFAMNSVLAERYPYLLHKIVERGDQLMCHGAHMDALHYGGMDIDEERAQIHSALNRLRDMSGQPVNSWISPAKSESEHTPALLADAGIEYFCDWVNDDMPYRFRTQAGELTAMPLSTELEDRFILLNNLHSEDSYVEQIKDAFDFLYHEANTQGGRILALSIHPWMLGQAHRIAKLEEVLEYITGHADVWSAHADDIHKAWVSQSSKKNYENFAPVQ